MQCECQLTARDEEANPGRERRAPGLPSHQPCPVQTSDCVGQKDGATPFRRSEAPRETNRMWLGSGFQLCCQRDAGEEAYYGRCPHHELGCLHRSVLSLLLPLAPFLLRLCLFASTTGSILLALLGAMLNAVGGRTGGHDFRVFACFDGHGGKTVADFAAREFVTTLQSQPAWAGNKGAQSEHLGSLTHLERHFSPTLALTSTPSAPLTSAPSAPSVPSAPPALHHTSSISSPLSCRSHTLEPRGNNSSLGRSHSTGPHSSVP